MFTSVALLLTFDQLWQQYADVSVMHADLETYLVCNSCVICMHDVIRISSPPLHLQHFQERTQSIIPMSVQVDEK